MNFTETPSIRNPREFLAVILAGFGNELQPLSSNYGDQPCPKALLPIGNKPMISYVLNWIEESGIKDVLLICPTSHRGAISHHIHSDPSSSALSPSPSSHLASLDTLSSRSLNIDIQTFDQSQDLSAGTATVLAHFAPRIEGDFVLLPCDFIPPKSLKLETVLDKFRVESGTDGALVSALFYERQKGEKSKEDDAWGPPNPSPPILYDKASGTLLHVDTLDDQDANPAELELRMATLWRYPRATLTTRLADAHVYACRRSVLDVLEMKKRGMDSVREEFIPWLARVGTQRVKREKYADVLNPITNTPAPHALALQHSTLYSPPPKSSRPKAPHPVPPLSHLRSSATPLSRTTSHLSQPPSPTLSEEGGDDAEPSLRVGVVVHHQKDGHTARANELGAYLELNRAMLTDLPPASHDATLVDPHANISADTLLGPSARVGSRSTVKRSTVGAHCVVGSNVKMNGCVVMEYCVIGDGAKLENCILGKNTRVGVKAELVRCVTQAGFEVEAGGVYKNEKLDVSDWTAGPVGSGDEEEDDSEDEDEDESGSVSEESED